MSKVEQILSALAAMKPDELRRVNSEAVRLIRAATAQGAQEFRIGERVWFTPSGRGRIDGVVERVNLRSVSVKPSIGPHWRVSPTLLHRAGE